MSSRLTKKQNNTPSNPSTGSSGVRRLIPESFFWVVSDMVQIELKGRTPHTGETRPFLCHTDFLPYLSSIILRVSTWFSVRSW